MSPAFPNPFTWYRLSVNYLPESCLDVINDGTSQTQGKLQMARKGNYSGQHWQFLPSPEGPFCLRTMYTGTDMFLTSENCGARLSRGTNLDAWRWHVEPVSADVGSKVRLWVELPEAPGEHYYLAPQLCFEWVHDRKLRISKLEDAFDREDLEWTLTEITPVRTPEFGLSPPVVSLSTDDGWTNVLGSSGESDFSFLESLSLPADMTSPSPQMLGWSYRLDAIRDTLFCLDAYTLEWKEYAINGDQGLSGYRTGLSFSAWSPTYSNLDLSIISSFSRLLSPERTIVVDVSHGFSSPTSIGQRDEFPMSHELDHHHYSESPPTYLCKSLLFSHQTSENGLSYLFYISKGTTLIQTDDDSSSPGHISGVLTFRMLKDWTTITVPVENILRIGVEDPFPLELTWPDKEFEERETIPVQHISHLGHGGQAVVDKVFCTGRVFARKQIRTISKVLLVSVHRKLETFKRVQTHHHLVSIFGVYTQGGTVGILLHPVAECDLQAMLERYSDPDSELFAGRISYRNYKNRFFEYFGCLAHALTYMHLKSILHRDIRPHKILVTFNGPMYTDFGIERDFEEFMLCQTSSLTERTYEYCAPEVAAGRESGRSADVFSLGCIFLELFTILTDRGSFNDCRQRRRTNGDPSYYANKEKIDDWITEMMLDELRSASLPHNSRLRLLAIIREMLNPDLERRPSALDVWKFTTSSTLDLEGPIGDSEYRPQMCGACCFDRPRY